MIYIVTGTPGTGKTTFAKKLAKEKDLIYYDGNKIIKDNNISIGFDQEKDCVIVDEKVFAKVCNKIILDAKKENKSIIIDSHLSHNINSKLVDICFVTECDISVLNKRLEKRKYLYEKIRENLDAEIFKICRIEAQEKNHNIEIINTT